MSLIAQLHTARRLAVEMNDKELLRRLDVAIRACIENLLTELE